MLLPLFASYHKWDIDGWLRVAVLLFMAEGQGNSYFSQMFIFWVTHCWFLNINKACKRFKKFFFQYNAYFWQSNWRNCVFTKVLIYYPLFIFTCEPLPLKIKENPARCEQKSVSKTHIMQPFAHRLWGIRNDFPLNWCCRGFRESKPLRLRLFWAAANSSCQP